MRNAIASVLCLAVMTGVANAQYPAPAQQPWGQYPQHPCPYAAPSLSPIPDLARPDLSRQPDVYHYHWHDFGCQPTQRPAQVPWMYNYSTGNYQRDIWRPCVPQYLPQYCVPQQQQWYYVWPQ